MTPADILFGAILSATIAGAIVAAVLFWIGSVGERDEDE